MVVKSDHALRLFRLEVRFWLVVSFKEIKEAQPKVLGVLPEHSLTTMRLCSVHVSAKLGFPLPVLDQPKVRVPWREFNPL